MPAYASITIHDSQWPEVQVKQLRASLRSGRLNHKFHYDSPRQVRHWLQLHEAHSPARRETEFQASYAPAFTSVVEQLGAEAVHLIGLGCGGGQKEAALLSRLREGDRPVSFTASDVSSGMVLTALQAAWGQMDPDRCSGLVCDLAEVQDLHEFFDPQTPAGARRVVTFFGMIPNFEPELLRAVLQRMLRPGDLLLSSANLAPGSDYRLGVERVLPQYDNELTRDWLGLLLHDVGIARDAGQMTFGIEESPPDSGLLRITARFAFREPATATVAGEVFEFEAGSTLQLFFSYRHTVDSLGTLFAASSLQLRGSWISDTGEEGVFLAASESLPVAR